MGCPFESHEGAVPIDSHNRGKKKSRTTVLGHMSVLDLCEGGGRRELVTFSFSDMWRQKGLCQEEGSRSPGRGQMPSLVLI